MTHMPAWFCHVERQILLSVMNQVLWKFIAGVGVVWCWHCCCNYEEEILMHIKTFRLTVKYLSLAALSCCRRLL